MATKQQRVSNISGSNSNNNNNKSSDGSSSQNKKNGGGGGGSNNNNKKRKTVTLFSFFGKKNKKSTTTTTESLSDSKNNHGGSNNNNNNASGALLSSSSSSSLSKSKKSSSTSNSSPLQKTLPYPVSVGTRIEVFWPDDDEYYKATVEEQQKGSSSSCTTTFFIRYDDNETEWIDLMNHTYRFIGTSNTKKSSLESKKRRRVKDDDDDDEGEMEFEDQCDDDDNDEEFKAGAEEEEDEEEEEEQWLVDDENEDDADACEEQSLTSTNKKKNKGRKRLRKSNNNVTITEHVVVETTKPRMSTNNKSPPSSASRSTSSSATSSNLESFRLQPSTVTPVLGHRTKPATTASSSATKKSTGRSSNENITPNKMQSLSPPAHHQSMHSSTGKQQPQQSGNKQQQVSKSKPKPPPFVEGEINPAGSHVHNHLAFMQNPKDLHGRTQDHPEYDPRTLRVIEQDWFRVTKKKMTPATQQWWDIKSRYNDAVLFFKTGKFYELYNNDADIGVNVCDLKYMKGHIAHAGFPEIAYAEMADRLVRAGYKVARVEQTETPEQLKDRKNEFSKKKKGGRGAGSAPQVVNREVCSVTTIGTRTFCYLDDTKFIDECTASGKDAAMGSVGPLLAIREVLISSSSSSGDDEQQNNQDDDDNDNDDNAVQPVCEYGITLIDVVNGIVTIGQFSDDILRSRMNTLLCEFSPPEILLEGGSTGASPTLLSLIRSLQTNSQLSSRVEFIQQVESYPKSTALDPEIRRQMERGGNNNNSVQPWNVEETLHELHRGQYYPRGSKQVPNSTTRWPDILKAAVQGGANLALSSLGAALYYLQRGLIDREIMSMGIVRAYIPPTSSVAADVGDGGGSSSNSGGCNEMQQLAVHQTQKESGADMMTAATAAAAFAAQPGANDNHQDQNNNTSTALSTQSGALQAEHEIDHMSLDGTTLHNLEILTNSVDYKVAGSLWSKINHTKTPHGARLLRAWLLRPLFRKADIDRRADAVEELVSGAAAVALSEATAVLSKCGDIQRLLSRVHSMGGAPTAGSENDDGDGNARIHPNDRAVLYEEPIYTKRKVGVFSKVLNGLRRATQIPEIFSGIEIESGLLCKIVRLKEDGGRFPDMIDELDWFFDNFDCDKAKKGLFEPTAGMDVAYDEASEAIQRVKQDLLDYKEDMCTQLKPRAQARSSWKYLNTGPDAKDKYLIELPANVAVPDTFIMKGKRGSGAKQMNKYRTSVVEKLVAELDQALEIQRERKARGMQLIFAKFDSKRHLWDAAAQTTALLDALGSLAKLANTSGYTRPEIINCPPNASAQIHVLGGRHPCVESSLGASEFIPNDLTLGGSFGNQAQPRVLLLSGPNMGGKSTLLRQTCLISIMAQLGSYVPADECKLTPIDRIYTRLGASDRILLGQSTFFVELAETAAALRGATRRSLVIMDELGRGTSTFDGTAIASATVRHLVERTKCLTLFATHYHSLLDAWKSNNGVKLGHMECIVENNHQQPARQTLSSNGHGNDGGDVTGTQGNGFVDEKITFLYTLGDGVCPSSFGINVARLAGLPEMVLTKAKRISNEFERKMNDDVAVHSNKISPSNVTTVQQNASNLKRRLLEAVNSYNWEEVTRLWEEIQSDSTV